MINGVMRHGCRSANEKVLIKPRFFYLGNIQSGLMNPAPDI